jgi:hypothetical protein
MSRCHNFREIISFRFCRPRLDSGGGQPHSKTLRAHGCTEERASVLECGCPLPLWPTGSRPLGRHSWARGIGVAMSAISLVYHPQVLLACAACAGQSDSKMAQGMNWGIFSLLGIIVVVLGTITAFFIYLARRSALAAAVTGRASVPASPNFNDLPEKLGLARTLPLAQGPTPFLINPNESFNG